MSVFESAALDHSAIRARVYLRRGVRSCVEDDVRHGAPPPRRAKNLANLSIHAQLMDQNEGTSELSLTSLSSTKPEIIDCNEEMVGTSSQGDAETASDVCAICLMPRTDPTLLDSCYHSFCFICTSQWLKYAGKCPLCMTPVSSFFHNLDLPPDLRPLVSVAELRAAAEAARLVERGRSLPPLNEQECVKLRIRRLQRRLHTVQEQMSSKSSRVDQSSELASTSVRLVNEISRLEMLKRDSTTRCELVSNITFRSLIYKDNLEWSSIDRNANRVRFSPEVFNANAPAATERLRPFVDRELKIVWRSRNLRLAGLYPVYLERFQTELFDFASSMVSLEDFDSMSAYSSKELRQLLRRRNRRAASTQEIVLLSEGDSDSAVIVTYPNRNNDDVIVLSDDSQSGEQSILSRLESNYVRDEAASSNSEASNFGDFYTRPACRLPCPTPGPIHVVDSFGFSREVFPRPPKLLLRSMPMNSTLNASNNEQLPTSAASLGHGDSTIVLSSDDEGGTMRYLTTAHRADVGASLLMHANSSLSSKQTCPELVDWLNPSSAEEKQNLEQHKQDLPNCSHSTHRVDVTSPQHSLRIRSSSSQDQMLCVHNCVKSEGEVDGEATLSKRGTSLSEPPSTLTVQPNILHDRNTISGFQEESCSQRNTAISVGDEFVSRNTCYDSSECSANVSSATSHVTSSCNIPTGSWLPEVTSCGSTVMPISLFKPTIKNMSCEFNQDKGEKELLTTMWKERQRRLATSPQSSSFNSTVPLLMEQEEEQKKEADPAEKITCHHCGQQNLKTSPSHPLFSGSTVDPVVVDLSNSYQQSSWNSSNLVDVPSTSRSFQGSSSADGIQSSYDNTAPDTIHNKRDRKKKRYSWKFLFKQFRRKLRHERSRRKRKKLYEFIEKMKKKLDEEDSEKSSESDQNDESNEELLRGSQLSAPQRIDSAERSGRD
uniref:RING-type E3 ubiquitin transferase n=1 Tax=Angiostrongylus cantonensis TaxID=6313 RepID=A0A0K0CYH6_ANGCA